MIVRYEAESEGTEDRRGEERRGRRTHGHCGVMRPFASAHTSVL